MTFCRSSRTMERSLSRTTCFRSTVAPQSVRPSSTGRSSTSMTSPPPWDFRRFWSEHGESAIARSSQFRSCEATWRSARFVLRRTEVHPFTDNADRPPQDLRRPGRHRHRERAAVHGAAGEGNRAADRVLEQQTATSEILRVIAARRRTSSPCSTPWPRAPPACARRTEAAVCPPGRRPASTRRAITARSPAGARRQGAVRSVRGTADRPRGARRADCPRRGRAGRRPSAYPEGNAVAPDRSVTRHADASSVPLVEKASRSARSRSADRGPAVHRPADRARSRPSPTRRSSPSRTCGCSRSWRRATRAHDSAGAADGDQRDPARHQRARRRTCNRCSTRSCRARHGCAMRTTAAVLPRRRTSIVYHRRELRRRSGGARCGTARGIPGPSGQRAPCPGWSILARPSSTIPDVEDGLASRSRSRRSDAMLGFRSVVARADAARGRSRRRHRRDATRGPGRSPTSRSRCSRPSPTRPSSPSRTCGCSRSSRRATAS